MSAIRNGGRGRLSTIDLLPSSCAEDVLWLRTELTARSRTQVDILSEFNARLAAKGQKPITDGTFSRFSIAHARHIAARDWDREKRLEVAFADNALAESAVAALNNKKLRRLIDDCGFADPKEAKRAARRALFGDFIGDHSDLIEHDIEQKRLAIMPLLLRGLHLAARDLNRCTDMLRSVDAAGGYVGQDELLERAEVILQLIEALFNRVGHESVSINDASVEPVATGEKPAAHRLSEDAE